MYYLGRELSDFEKELLSDIMKLTGVTGKTIDYRDFGDYRCYCATPRMLRQCNMACYILYLLHI